MEMEIKINKQFKALIPALSPEELSQLKANILRDGIRDPLVVWKKAADEFILIDGHNRYEIALKHGLGYRIEEVEFEDEDEVKEWMILHQFGRRNLSSYQRSVLALKLEEVFKEKAKESLSEKVSHFRQTGEVLENSTKPKIDTRKEVAKIANVSDNTIARVKKIEEKAPEEVKEKLASGEVSINEVYQEIRKEEKKQQREQDILQQKLDIETNKLPELKGVYDVISVDPPWPYGREYDPDGSRVANPYPEMSIEDIKAIKLPLNDNSVIFLWTTHAFLKDAFDILNEWGATYKATMVWNKQKLGMGAWLRMQCEFCLVGIVGKPYWQNTKYPDIINEARREHSRKPDAFFNTVNEICAGRKLEYFSREAREGWEIFGNDINKF
jgi:N6-adenosine-specific RNA methylase IME4